MYKVTIEYCDGKIAHYSAPTKQEIENWVTLNGNSYEEIWVTITPDDPIYIDWCDRFDFYW